VQVSLHVINFKGLIETTNIIRGFLVRYGQKLLRKIRILISTIMVKENLSLCLPKNNEMINKAQRHEELSRSEIIALRILNFVTTWKCAVKSHTPTSFPLGKWSPNTRWIRGWVAPGVGLDALAKRENLFSDCAENRMWSFIPQPNHYVH